MIEKKYKYYTPSQIDELLNDLSIYQYTLTDFEKYVLIKYNDKEVELMKSLYKKIIEKL